MGVDTQTQQNSNISLSGLTLLMGMFDPVLAEIHKSTVLHPNSREVNGKLKFSNA